MILHHCIYSIKRRPSVECHTYAFYQGIEETLLHLGNPHHPDNYDSFSGNNLEHISVSHNIYKWFTEWFSDVRNVIWNKRCIGQNSNGENLIIDAAFNWVNTVFVVSIPSASPTFLQNLNKQMNYYRKWNK